MLTSVVRLLEEDPDGWRGCDDYLIHSAIGYRIKFGSRGPESVNGFVLGWWRRFVLRRAVWRRAAFLVDRHLAERDRIETERLLAAG